MPALEIAPPTAPKLLAKSSAFVGFIKLEPRLLACPFIPLSVP